MSVPSRDLDEFSDDLLPEQVAALFQSVAGGVIIAAVSAPIVGFTLSRIGSLRVEAAVAWSSFIIVCAITHIALDMRYRRNPHSLTSKHWALMFTIVAFAEGVGWSLPPTALAGSERFEVTIFAAVSTVGVTAGAISAFGPYLPAFFALVLPATLPYAAINIFDDDPLRRASAVLMWMFLLALIWLGVKGNRTFGNIVGLRLSVERLAVELRHQKEVAEQASLAKSAFLAAASHDLRQPVHALGLFVGALKAVEMGQEGRELVLQIEQSTIAMDNLFSALLDISKLDAGTVEVHRAVFAIDGLLERICNDYRREATAKGLRLRLVRSNLAVTSDPLLVERVIRNLISNAVRYTEAGSVVIGARRRGKIVAVQVLDSGPGIAAAEHELIFGEYYQLGNAERDRAKGLGLGLAIVRRLSDLLAAPISVRSTPGKGSVFEFILPRADHLDVPNAPLKDERRGAFASGFIVFIDDEMAIREAMTRLLSNWGHQVLVAGSGDEAVERLAGTVDVPDLIISDYRLRNGENGIAVIEKLRSEFNHSIPAMLITGDTAPNRLREAQQSGLVLLHKPIPNGKLRAAINNVMASVIAEAIDSEA